MVEFPKDLVMLPEHEVDDEGVLNARQRAGRQGEHMTTQLLRRLHPHVQVVCVNKDNEQGLPYDIELREDGIRVACCVEVKTVSVDKSKLSYFVAGTSTLHAGSKHRRAGSNCFASGVLSESA